jgi:hypothetical protein
MPYLNCAQNHASFHSGLLYVHNDSCPRCGAPFHPPRPSLREQFERTVLRRRPPSEKTVDWETITSSLYADRRYVSRSPSDGKLANDRAYI